jgi:hypothetical protein
MDVAKGQMPLFLGDADQFLILSATSLAGAGSPAGLASGATA